MSSQRVDDVLGGRRVGDLSEKHFSRYGEFLVSFELSKYGWNVYSPVYDEYIDFIIHKYTCRGCGRNWGTVPALICSSCGKDFSKTAKRGVIAKKVCLVCGAEMVGNVRRCTACGGTNIANRPTCDACGGLVSMEELKCVCGSCDYDTMFRTIQVKSSRVEYDENTRVSKFTYAVDMKPKDLIGDGYHHFVWCLLDNSDAPHFLIMTVADFKETMGDSLKGISFLKDQDRQHFSSRDFGKWVKYKDRFDKLDLPIVE